MFTINALGVEGELARCLSTMNIIESPNSVVRRIRGRVTNDKDASKAMRWPAAGFLETEKSFRRVRSHSQIKALIETLRPQKSELKAKSSNQPAAQTLNWIRDGAACLLISSIGMIASGLA